jgi:CBS domain-containing protein
MQIGELCGHEVVTCAAGASAPELAQAMRERHVGDVLVVDAGAAGGARPLGIVTDRDLVVRVLAARVDPERVTAGDMMSPVRTALESEDVYDAIWHMRRDGHRRLQVVDAQGALVGLVTLDDLAQFLAEELTELTRVSPQQRQLEMHRLG